MSSFTHTVTGATNRSTIFRGDVGLVSGTWTSHVASGTIVTGGGTVLAYGVTVGSAYITSIQGVGSVTARSGSAIVHTNANKGGSGSQEYGSIQVKEIDNLSGVSGDWWAITRI